MGYVPPFEPSKDEFVKPKHKIYDRKLELFVTNLSSETTESDIRQHFKSCG